MLHLSTYACANIGECIAWHPVPCGTKASKIALFSLDVSSKAKPIRFIHFLAENNLCLHSFGKGFFVGDLAELFGGCSSIPLSKRHINK